MGKRKRGPSGPPGLHKIIKCNGLDRLLDRSDIAYNESIKGLEAFAKDQSFIVENKVQIIEQ